MGASQEVRFKIGGDTASLERSFARLPAMAEAAGRKAEKAFKIPRKPKDYNRAESALADFRAKRDFNEASTVGKIKILTGELNDLALAHSTTQKNTAKYLKEQLAIEQKLVSLRKLQKTAQGERAAGVDMPAEEAKPSTPPAGTGLGFGALLVRGIAAAVGFGIERITAWNASRVAVDNAKAQSSQVGLDSLRGTFATIGGTRGQLTQGYGALKDLERQRDFSQSRADFLSSGAQGAVSHLSPGELQKAEEETARLNGEIQRQHNANQIIERDLQRQQALRTAQFSFATKSTGKITRGPNGRVDLGSIEIDTKNPIGAIPETERAKVKGSYTALQAIIIEGRRLVKVALAEKNFGTPDSAAEAGLAVERQRNEGRSAVRELQRRQQDIAQQLTAQAAEGGRTFGNGQARPRSETERLAQRAERYRQRARDAVLTGARSDAARFTTSARTTEAGVLERLSQASSLIPKQRGIEDSSAVAVKLENTNTLLTSIKDSLSSVTVESR